MTFARLGHAGFKSLRSSLSGPMKKVPCASRDIRLVFKEIASGFGRNLSLFRGICRPTVEIRMRRTLESTCRCTSRLHHAARSRLACSHERRLRGATRRRKRHECVRDRGGSPRKKCDVGRRQVQLQTRMERSAPDPCSSDEFEALSARQAAWCWRSRSFNHGVRSNAATVFRNKCSRCPSLSSSAPSRRQTFARVSHCPFEARAEQPCRASRGQVSPSDGPRKWKTRCKSLTCNGFATGGASGTRTPDLRIMIPSL